MYKRNKTAHSYQNVLLLGLLRDCSSRRSILIKLLLTDFEIILNNLVNLIWGYPFQVMSCISDNFIDYIIVDFPGSLYSKNLGI